MAPDIYRELSRIDLTDKGENKLNLFKYLLLSGYIEDINSPSKYKPKYDNEKWLIKFMYMHYWVSKDLLTPVQWKELFSWVYFDIIGQDKLDEMGYNPYNNELLKGAPTP